VPVSGGYANWVSGNSNGTKSHWREGDFIAYRTQVSGPAGTGYDLSLSYDPVHSGGHAIDYLGSYDATETPSIACLQSSNGLDVSTCLKTSDPPEFSPLNADYSNPCADLSGGGLMLTTDCPDNGSAASPTGSPGSVPATCPSTDTTAQCNLLNLTAISQGATCGGAGSSGTVHAGSGFTQLSGAFKIFGPSGTTVTGVSYSSQNVLSGTSTCITTVHVQFDIGGSGTETVVLAWGGHIATTADWGAGNSATGISGSPYHMSLNSLSINGIPTTVGSQDRALSSSAIISAPTIATSIDGNATTTVPAGASVFDTATLAGASSNAGGTVTYDFFTGSLACSGTPATQIVSVTNAVVPNSTPQTLNSAGSYSYNAIYSGDSGNAGPVTSPCEPLTVQPPNLQITKVADHGTVNAGDAIGYVVTIGNTGAGTATGVTVSDTLPSNSGLSWSIDAGGTTGTWTITSGVLHFGPVDLASGISFHVHITSPTTAATCGTVNNTASATTTNDGNPSVGPVPITVNCASVTITKTADQGTVSAGDPIGYVVTVTNTGAGTAHSVAVSDTLPTNSGLSWSIDAGTTTGT
jgi:uncharacterized repeat protein (TIGR01451 family)